MTGRLGIVITSQKKIMTDYHRRRSLHLCISMWHGYHLWKINHGDFFIIVNLQWMELKV